MPIAFGNLPRLDDLPADLEGAPLLMRLDLNVPLEDTRITSDARIRAALPTIRWALERGARVALCSHLGRPKGKRRSALSLESVGVRLGELLSGLGPDGVDEVLLADNCVGDGVRKMVQEQRPRQLILLENLRFDAREVAGDDAFAQALAAPFRYYVNDAFGACHRAHASVVGVPARMPRGVVAAGRLLEQELRALGGLLHAPKKPFVAVVGGLKVADKLDVLLSLLPLIDVLCIGGAMAYTFLAAKGDEVGASLVESERIADARLLLTKAEAKDVQVLLPSDHITADEADIEASGLKGATALGPSTVIAPTHMGLDIGPDTQARYAKVLAQASTVFWNGPMGVFEVPAFSAGTKAVAEAVASCSGFTVVGGGDSTAALEAMNVIDEIDHVSTGGGASLELLQRGSLVGIDALLQAKT